MAVSTTTVNEKSKESFLRRWRRKFRELNKDPQREIHYLVSKVYNSPPLYMSLSLIKLSCIVYFQFEIEIQFEILSGLHHHSVCHYHDRN